MLFKEKFSLPKVFQKGKSYTYSWYIFTVFILYWKCNVELDVWTSPPNPTGQSCRSVFQVRRQTTSTSNPRLRQRPWGGPVVLRSTRLVSAQTALHSVSGVVDLLVNRVDYLTYPSRKDIFVIGLCGRRDRVHENT